MQINKTPIEDRVYTGSSKPLKDCNQVTVNIQLEYLDFCAYNCDGCFVKRRNTYTNDELIELKRVAESFGKDYELNELILSPTDIFGARNTKEIITNPHFIDLFQHFNALTFNTTLQSDHEHIKATMKMMRDNLPKHIYFESFIVLDIDKMLDHNMEYIRLVEDNIANMGDVNVIFVYNISSRVVNNFDIAELTKLVNSRFNSHYKMNPSFFRSNKPELIMNNLNMWKEHATQIYNNNKHVLFHMLEPYFGGDTYISLTVKNGMVSINPYIYDYIIEPKFKQHKIEDITLNRLQNIIYDNKLKQYEISHKLDCKNCRMLTSCVNRDVLMYMDVNNINTCFLPKDIMLKANNLEI